MDVALSRNGAWLLRAFFALVVVFLYAPIVILLIFSFNDSRPAVVPAQRLHARTGTTSSSRTPTSGALKTSADHRRALERRRGRCSASSPRSRSSAVASGARRRVSALLLSPLVIPYVVFGISLLLLFHAVGHPPRSILTVVIGHIVITLPYTILVLMPRLQQIDVSLEEAAYDLGASRLRTFRSITLPLILPAVVSAFLIAFTTSFDEYAVASFVVGPRVTFPIYLYAALRFPSQLPQVIAVAVVVIAGLAGRRRRRRGRTPDRRAPPRRSESLGESERARRRAPTCARAPTRA